MKYLKLFENFKPTHITGADNKRLLVGDKYDWFFDYEEGLPGYRNKNSKEWIHVTEYEEMFPEEKSEETDDSWE